MTDYPNYVDPSDIERISSLDFSSLPNIARMLRAVETNRHPYRGGAARYARDAWQRLPLYKEFGIVNESDRFAADLGLRLLRRGLSIWPNRRIDTDDPLVGYPEIAQTLVRWAPSTLSRGTINSYASIFWLDPSWSDDQRDQALHRIAAKWQQGAIMPGLLAFQRWQAFREPLTLFVCLYLDARIPRKAGAQ